MRQDLREEEREIFWGILKGPKEAREEKGRALVIGDTNARIRDRYFREITSMMDE